MLIMATGKYIEQITVNFVTSFNSLFRHYYFKLMPFGIILKDGAHFAVHLQCWTL